jgi:hypothetical protein
VIRSIRTLLPGLYITWWRNDFRLEYIQPIREVVSYVIPHTTSIQEIGNTIRRRDTLLPVTVDTDTGINTRIIVLIDNEVEASLFRAMFHSRQDITYIGECSDINWLREGILTYKPDVLLISRITMYEDTVLEIVQRIRGEFPELYMLVLVGHAPEEAAISEVVSFTLSSPLLMTELLAVVRHQPKRSSI